MKRFATSLVLVLATAGCATAGGNGNGSQNPFDGDSQPGEIQLVVVNHDFSDATLFAFRGAERIRLGVVTGKAERSYTLPWPTTQTLQVEISLLSQGSCRTDQIAVDPGEVLELQIQDQAMRRGGECLGPRGG